MDVELHCSDCGDFIGMVSEDIHGHIGAMTLCDGCDQDALDEIFNQ